MKVVVRIFLIFLIFLIPAISLTIATAAWRAAAQAVGDPVAQRLRAATEEAGRGDLGSAEADVRAAIALDAGRAGAWYELGSVLGQAGDFSGAEAAFRRAIALQPEFAKAHFDLALTLIADPQSKQNWAEAIAECRAALKYQPNYPEAMNLLGAGLVNTGQADEAIQILERTVALAPALPQAHVNLATAYRAKDRREDAAKEYRAAIAVKADYPEAETGLGTLLFDEGKTAEAEKELDAALCLNPDLGDAHYALARLFRALKRSREATVEFAQAKEIEERHSHAIESSNLSNQGIEAASRGDLAGGIALLRKAVALNPEYGVSHYNLGLVLAESGNDSAALQELTKAVSLLPRESRIWFDLGRVLRLSGDRPGAIGAVSWAIHLTPGEPRYATELASLRASKDSAEAKVGVANDSGTEAERPERPKIGAATDTAGGHLAFGVALEGLGDDQGAVGEWLRALTLEPATIQARRGLAAAYVHMGDKDRATLEYYKVLRCDGEDADSRLAMGKLLLAQGETSEAVANLRLAVQYRPDWAGAVAALAEAEKSIK